MQSKDQTHILLIGAGSYGAFIERAISNLKLSFSTVDGRDIPDEEFAKATHVILATPNFTHYDIVTRCLKAGKHVLCEKPLALTLEEVDELYKQAKANSCYLGVGFVLPNHPFYQWVKTIQREWGEIVNIEVHNHATEGELQPEWYWDKSKSGGWFMVAEIHWYQLYFWLMESDDYHAVTGSERVVNSRTTETATVIMDTPKSFKLSIHHKLNMTQTTHWAKVEVYFANGNHVVLDDWVPNSLTLPTTVLASKKDLYKFQAYILFNGEQYIDTRSRDDRYADMVRFNIEAMLNDQPQDEPSIRAAHKAALEAQEASNQKLDKAQPAA